MPFVRLGDRSTANVVLDDEKVRLAAQRQARDQAKVAEHYGINPSSQGYKFGKHPMTRGFVRSPPPPFAKANSPWNPPEADPNSPAGQLQSTMAKNGAFWDGSHQHLGKSRSSPQLQHSGENVMACHPLSAELRRWERLAAVTERGEVNKDIQLATMSGKMSESVEEEKPRGRVGGLVNFPKYMLINNCHLKTTDLGRFQREQVELQRQADETAARGDTSSEATMDNSIGEGSVPFATASWGAPLLRQKNTGTHWAGSGLPGGRMQRHSSFLRMG
mmetsp:Transcript_45774/g.74389  ORF Transcript_45774/g.74389 Transcript_45774/m.74389 type:complete len:275 (-) Transcript_45774:68-892(-)|eukprot:CAMPEP_0115091878 /NCGR_PEP_ID=MMETSP0227-20121206/26387_1 /TAXON_ID=89957 /ORGANISM="Polarella glacialis, Strain CCMP 1383" /LENGTH=274 /DNA_ID=CAMNT_0002483499 /DNA_START=62 /DNA_END=886 /DNA_ORIENTATION=-